MNTTCRKAIDLALNNLKTDPKKWEVGICAGYLYGTEGEIIANASSGDICHAFYHRGKQSRTDVEVATSTLSERKRKVGEEEHHREFMKYLAQENPVGRQFIINKDDLSSIYEGGIVIDARRAGHNRTLWLGKAFRYCNEEPYRVEHWIKLVEKGVHPLVAMISASIYTQNGSFTDAGLFTHAQVFANPESIEALSEALFVKKFNDLKNYSEIGRKPKEDTSTVFWARQWKGDGYGFRPENKRGIIENCLKERREKVSDGWGGYIEKKTPGDFNCLVEHLQKLTSEAEKIGQKKKGNK